MPTCFYKVVTLISTPIGCVRDFLNLHILANPLLLLDILTFANLVSDKWYYGFNLQFPGYEKD